MLLLLSFGLLAGGIALCLLTPSLLIYSAYPWPVYVLMLGSVGAAMASGGRAALRYSAVGITGLVTLLFLVVTLGIGWLSHGEIAVRVGEPFPDFRLQTSTKEWFSPSQLKGQSAALYIFYRGDW
jgi:hypothetical protein